MKNLIFFILGLIMISCSTNVKHEVVTSQKPKEYILAVRFLDNSIDTLTYQVRDTTNVLFTIKTIEYQLMNRDIPITPTLVAVFRHGNYTENVAVGIKSYKIIKEIY